MMARKTIVITADGSELITTINQVNKTLDGMAKNSTKQAAATQKALQGIGDAAKFATAGVKTLAAGLVITATGGGLQSILRTADSFKQLTARVNLASEGLGDASANYAQLSKQAQAAGTYLETTVSVFQRMAMVAPSLQATNAEILRVTDTVQKLSVITGAGSEAMKYGLTQLGQAFGQTYIMAEEFNSLNENIPGVLKAVADQMGVTTGELRNMQREGKLASKDFFEALLAASAKADEAFTKMPVTVERATNSIRISFTNMVGKFDEATGATSTLAKGMVGLSKGFDDTVKSVEAVSKAYKEHKLVVDTLVLSIAGAGGFLFALRAIPVIVPAVVGGIGAIGVSLGGLLAGVTALINPVGVLVAGLGALAGIEVANVLQQGQAKLRQGELKAAQGQAALAYQMQDPKFLQAEIAKLEAQKRGLGSLGLGIAGGGAGIDSQLKSYKDQLARLQNKGKPPSINIPKVSIPATSGGGGRGRAGGGGRAGRTTVEKEFVAERIDPLSDYMEGLFSRSTEILNSLKTPLDTFNEQVAELDMLAKNNLIGFDAFNAKLAEYRQELDATLPASEALTGVWEDYANAGSKASSAMNDLQQVTVNVGTEFSNMVANMELDFGRLAASLARDLTRVYVQLKIVTPLMNSLFGAQGQGGGLLSQLGASFMNQAKGFSMPTLRGLPIGGGGAPVPAMPMGFANGGMPPVGRPVLVGERGAELVTFGQQARVHSNADTKAMMGGSNVVVNIHNAPAGTETRRSQQGGIDMVDIIIGTVSNNIASGGRIAQNIGSRFNVNPASALAR